MDIIDKSLVFGKLEYGNNPKTIIVHHLEADGWSVERVHDLHKNEFGWSGIGYHYYIRKDGNIYKGRPDNAIGAHCKGANYNTIGVSFEGDYEHYDKVMPDVQFASWCDLKQYLFKKYGQMPILGHREAGNSDCPGRYFPLERVKAATAPVTAKKTWELNIDGDIIKELQRELNTQFNAGLTVDGWAGDKTMAALMPVKKGAKGNITCVIQKLLQVKGYGNYFSKYGVDGSFGPATDTAVRAFQKDYGLAVDGSVGPITWKALLRK